MELPMRIPPGISTHIKIARTTLGLTQRDLAAAAGCSNERLSQIERGSRPSPALLKRLTAALNGALRKARAR
jgi:transcriptional regulator with XRE-family HTH domain